MQKQSSLEVLNNGCLKVKTYSKHLLDEEKQRHLPATEAILIKVVGFQSKPQ